MSLTTPPKILLLGGHGKVAMHLIPLLLARNWDVTSVVRNPEHENEILALQKDKGKGKLSVLVSSLDDVEREEDAERVLERVKPDYVVWAAGAGGKGGPTRTRQIDQIASKHFITTSLSRPQVKKFLLISHIGSRRTKPAWISDDDWAYLTEINTQVLPDYFKAKIDADEYLTALAEKRNEKDGSDLKAQVILLRPGLLVDTPATGRVDLGKTRRGRGSVSREDVAGVVDALLARDDTGGWYDLLNGDEGIGEAVERVVRDRVDAVEGEDVEGMVKRFGL